MIAAQDVTFVPQFLDGSPHHPEGEDAYVRVRLSGHDAPSGAVTVYLHDGTALLVPERDLVRLRPADDSRR